MNKLTTLALALMLVPSVAFATEKSTADLQTDLGTYKLRTFNAHSDYAMKINITDSVFNKTTDTIDDITGLTGLTAAEMQYLNITTLGTAEASKALTFDASLDAILPTGAKVTINSGGELVIPTGATLTVDTVAVNHNALSLPGRATFTICGDGDTINNNTVYYGASMVPVAGAGRTCDITAAGNTTEATADAPAFEGTAFQVLSMDCLTVDPGASGVTFALRTAEGATVPSVTCTAANTDLGCTANVQTTTAIASGATVAIAASSAGDQGATAFACTVHVAY